jgi:hypothetical protein
MNTQVMTPHYEDGYEDPYGRERRVVVVERTNGDGNGSAKWVRRIIDTILVAGIVALVAQVWSLSVQMSALQVKVDWFMRH